MNGDIKVIFMGTPDFAVKILNRLDDNFKVSLVVSQPDAPVGRKKILEESPVAKRANELGIEVIKPIDIKVDYERILEEKPKLIVTCAYGQIIPKKVLDAPKYGSINVHASLLPKYRGGAPIQRAIIDGEKETGITIMYMDEHMDSGDMIAQESIPILDSDTLDTMNQKLSKLGSELLIDTIPKIIDGTANRIKQNEEEVTFAPIIKREDELLDFTESTKKVIDRIRGLISKPCAYFKMNGQQFKVMDARTGNGKGKASTIIGIYKDGFGIATGDGEIVITKIKPEGKKEMLARDYLNGISKEKFLGSVVNDRLD